MFTRFNSVLAMMVYTLCLALLLGAVGVGTIAAGDEIAFVGIPGTDNELFTVDVSTGVLHNLTRSKDADVSFSWSPDGSQMAFVRRSDASRLYLMEATGRNVRRWHEGLIPIFPQWSPDGTMIAFLGNRASGLPDVFVMPAEGGIPVNLTATTAISEGDIDWSPDSAQIAVSSYTAGRHIDLIDLASGKMHKLVDNATLPRFSPDGKYVSFLRLDMDKPALWLKSMVDGSEIRQDTGSGAVVSFASAWSPDAGTIAVVKNEGADRLIYLLNVADGSGYDAAKMTQPISQVVWSPDGKRLGILTDTAIYTLDIAGDSLREVVDTGFPIRLGAWRPA